MCAKQTTARISGGISDIFDPFHPPSIPTHRSGAPPPWGGGEVPGGGRPAPDACDVALRVLRLPPHVRLLPLVRTPPTAAADDDSCPQKKISTVIFFYSFSLFDTRFPRLPRQYCTGSRSSSRKCIFMKASPRKPFAVFFSPGATHYLPRREPTTLLLPIGTDDVCRIPNNPPFCLWSDPLRLPPAPPSLRYKWTYGVKSSPFAQG